MNDRFQSPEYGTALAIVGMAGRFPGASTLEQFWQNIAGKVCSINFYSQEELLAAGIKPEDIQQPNYVRAGVVLENIDRFDASFFGFTPREAEIMDPQYRLFLECSWEALEVAGYDIEQFDGLVGVFAGSGYKNYLLHHVMPNQSVTNMMSEFQLSLFHEHDVLATQIAYRLNLKGPALTVQTFCSTSLAAVHLAAQSLLTYDCDIALAGGVALNALQLKGYFYDEGTVVSPNGHCHPFDARAHGSVMSNAVAVVALKRLQDALVDGDHIHAILRGSAMNNDGSRRVNYTAPGVDGQAAVIANAMSNAGVHPETIAYIEANGTGTRLGDAIELAAMEKAFASKTRKRQFCAIGSLKPNIGHVDRASGVAGLIKTALALSHRQLPPHLNYAEPNPDVNLEAGPFYINEQLLPWPKQQGPRRAGVSSFGLGGTNVHAILEEAPEQEPPSFGRPWQLLPLSAKTEWSLRQASANLAEYLRTYPEQSLADIAYTLQVGRSAFNYRQFVVARSPEEAEKELEALASMQMLSKPQTHRDRSLTFFFPDADLSDLSMMQDLYKQEETFREVVDECCQFLQQYHHLNISPFFCGTAITLPSAQIRQVEVAWSVTFVLEYALARLFLSWGLHVQAMVGNGPGEYVAACLADVLARDDALTLIVKQARQGKMSNAAEPTLSSPEERISLQAPRIPFGSGVTGTWISDEQATSPTYWIQRLNQSSSATPQTALFFQGGDAALITIGIEGPASNPLLQHQVTRQGESSLLVIPTLVTTGEHFSGSAALMRALGRLWLAGVSIDWQRLYTSEQRVRVPLPTYPFERQRYWLDDPTNCNVIRARAEAANSGETLSLSTVRPPLSTDFVAPETITEKKITEIWQLLLGIEQIGIYDNFFELKGQSLIGAQIVSRLQQAFQVDVPLTTIFEAPTIAELASVVETLLIEEIDKLGEEEALQQI